MFNSRNTDFKNPVGAVAEGTQVHFKIIVPRELRCSAACLQIEKDNTKEVFSYGMFWCGMSGENHEWWECDFTPEQTGLYFYHFEIDTWRGHLPITRQFGSEGGIDGKGARWQMTVYRNDFKTPDWLAGGVMYQIFPDRFYASGKPKKNVPTGRTFHNNWLEQPDWQPNEQGEVTNSDYFGGDLAGITEKLDYLQGLGVTCVYLNPIFEAHSNHRYNTGDYAKIDPLLGTEQDFRTLCREGKKRGISFLLDGVFSHTGSDSVYFNREGRYPGEGAYQSQSSPYYSWYDFQEWPSRYASWWNFETLPNVRETEVSYDEYINGDGGIVQKWLAAGAAGWRLDVADELPDGFIDHLTAAAKKKKKDALILGEVWEDASHKIAYGVRRRYLLGGQLDSVMNYPFRDAILGFLTGQNTAHIMELIGDVLENYPPQVIHLLMNHIGTHDTERAITMLAGEPMRHRGREWQQKTRLTPEQWELGIKRLKLAALMQYTLPGVPCVYYGDEAGMEGYRDPFNRACYPWGQENQELLDWYRNLGKLRQAHSVFKDGAMHALIADNGCLVYLRKNAEQEILIGLNATGETKWPPIPSEWHEAKAWLGQAPKDNLELPPYGCAVLVLEQ
ncbi:MAG: glycoside hydrolase family 13 protein [Clostridiales bacterium]|nr:glycoside hydrolase family 13 protein [Clostridiales bacterium]